VLRANQRNPEQERLLDQAFQPTFVGQAGGAKTEIGKAPGGAVHQRGHAKLLGETFELACGGRTLLQIHEVGIDPSLREKTERLSGFRALPRAENLNFQDLQSHDAGIYMAQVLPRAPD